MRQRKWLEFVKNYDCDIKHQSGKTSMTAYALSRKVSLSQISVDRVFQQEIYKEQIKMVIKALAILKIKSTPLEVLKVRQVSYNQCKHMALRLISRWLIGF